MHYKIRYPGSRPRTTTAKPKSTHNWMHQGTKMAGLHVAGQCIVCFLIFGFGLSVIGALSLLMSAQAGVHEGQYRSPPAIVGCTLLSTGGFFLFLGLVFFCCAARRAKRMLIRERSAGPVAKEAYLAPTAPTEDGSNTDPNNQIDPAVYYIKGDQDCAKPDQYASKNEGYITDKVDEPDEGFKGFTYTDMGQEQTPSTGDENERNGDLQPRGLPTRLPPISREEGATVYSTPATFGLKE